MYKLPSEQASYLQEAMSALSEGGIVILQEPCNCGSQIRHNNGGNYHQIIEVTNDSGQFFVKFDTTCELTPRAEWEEVDEVDARFQISNHSDWNIYFG